MNPLCPNCIEFETPCPGVAADKPVNGCYTPPSETSYNSAMIGDDEDIEYLTDRAPTLPVDDGRVARSPVASGRALEPAAECGDPDGSAIATGVRGGADNAGSPSAQQGPAPASVPSDMTVTGKRIMAVLTGRADPCSVPAAVLYDVLDSRPSLADRFRKRYGVAVLRKIIAAACPKPDAAVPGT